MSDLDAVSRVRAWRASVGAVLLPAVLALLLVALVATSVVLWRDRDRVPDAVATEAVPPADGDTDAASEGVEGLAAQAVEVGRRAAVAFFSLDYRSVGADVEQMLALTTGDFRDDYAATASRLRQRVGAQRLVLTPVVVPGGTATEYLTPGSAQILVSLDVTVDRVDRPTRTDAHRTRVVLERVDDRWLVSGLAEVV